MANFKIGDQVELIPGHYDEESTNPIKTRGVITKLRDNEYCYDVSWDNDRMNSYRECELKSYLMPDIKAKVGDLIRIHRDNGAFWLTSGTNYVVSAIDPMTTRIKVMDQWWACDNDDYTILSSQIGESFFDKEILEAQRRRIAKENALQRAAKEYSAGTKFLSFSGTEYIIADKPEFNWSENTEGIYANTTEGLRVYICKRDEWVKRVIKDLITEAKELFPPGTKFINSYGTTSEVCDDPEYSLHNSFVFAKCVTGSHVRIYKDDKWAEITDRTFDIEKAQEKLKKVLERQAISDEMGKFDYNTSSTTFNGTYDEFINKYFKTNKNQEHGTESNKSVKLQGTNLQIREGNLSRGVGLKSSRSKIKLGSNYSYN